MRGRSCSYDLVRLPQPQVMNVSSGGGGFVIDGGQVLEAYSPHVCDGRACAGSIGRGGCAVLVIESRRRHRARLAHLDCGGSTATAVEGAGTHEPPRPLALHTTSCIQDNAQEDSADTGTNGGVGRRGAAMVGGGLHLLQLHSHRAQQLPALALDERGLLRVDDAPDSA